MFLACVELAGSDELKPYQQQRRRYAGRVIELQFSHLETAKIWAEQEASRHQDATGNAAVFETLGPFVSLAWEHDAASAGEQLGEPPLERHESHRDELVERA